MKNALRYVALIGIFIIPFIPLFVANSMFFPFITGKNFAFRIVVEVIFAAWIVLAATDRSYRPKRSWILYAFAGFVGVMALADAVSMNPAKSFWSNFERMEGWVTLAHLFAYFIVASSVLVKEKLWDAFFQTSLGVNAVILAYSILQIAGFLTINQGGVRVDATFGNATYLAIYAVFHIFIAVLFLARDHAGFKAHKNGYLALGFNVGFFAFVLPMIGQSTSQSGAAYLWIFIAWIAVNALLYITVYAKQERVFYAVLVFFNLIALYNTATRGAILGLIGGAIVTSVLIAVFGHKHPFTRKIAVGVVAAAVLLVGGFFAVKDSQFVKESPVLSRFSSISLKETTTMSRFKLWNMAFEGFKERPILGWGQESFNYVFNEKYNPELYNQEQWFDRTHNVIFDWLIAGGIVGLLAYLAFFGSIVAVVWKRRHEQIFSLTEKALITGMLSAYFIHNLFVFDNLTSYIMFISIAAYVHHRASVRSEALHHEPVRNAFVAPVVAVAFLMVLYVVNVKPMLASSTLIKAISAPSLANDISDKTKLFKKALAYGTFGNQEIREQLLTFATQAAGADKAIKGREEFIELARQEGIRQTEETPQDARAYVITGGFVMQTGDLKTALELLKKAQELSPKKQPILFSIASVYMSQKDYTSAHEWLKQAFLLEPSYLNARLMYAASAIYIHNAEEAGKALAGIATSTVASNNDILAAYYETKQYGKLVVLWEQRVADDPSSAQGHVSLAAAYLLVGNRKGAVSEIQKAMDIEPAFKEQGEYYIKEIKAGRNP